MIIFFVFFAIFIFKSVCHGNCKEMLVVLFISIDNVAAGLEIGLHEQQRISTYALDIVPFLCS